MKSINVQGGIFVLCRVELSKIDNRDVTFIREVRVCISSIFGHNSKVDIVKNYTTEGCIAQGIAVIEFSNLSADFTPKV